MQHADEAAICHVPYRARGQATPTALEQGGLQTLTTSVVGWTLVAGEQDHARAAITPTRVR